MYNVAPHSLVAEARSLSTEFHYAKHAPIYVSVLHQYCEDQVQYLMEFLTRMDYTPERPFRFVYVPEARSSQILHTKRLNQHSILILMANEQKWQDFIELGAIYPNSVMMIHKDEYCEYNPRDIPNIGLAYHGYWDDHLIDDKTVSWVPLGVRKIFPRIFPEEIMASSMRFLFLFFLYSLIPVLIPTFLPSFRPSFFLHPV